MASDISKEEILRTQQIFKNWMLDGIQKAMGANLHLMAFILMSCAIDHLAGYRYPTKRPNKRYPDFIKNYFPKKYEAFEIEIYKRLRCGLVHAFSVGAFVLKEDMPEVHLKKTDQGKLILVSQAFYKDLIYATDKLFDEVCKNTETQVQERSATS